MSVVAATTPNHHTSPLPSVSNDAEGIASRCELREMTAPPPAAGQFVALTEMAALLFLGRYGDARHLWRRTNHGFDPTTSSSSAAAGNEDPELHQLSLLYSAAVRTRPSAHREAGIGGGVAASSSAFAGLNDCVESNLKPLASYAREVRDAARIRAAHALASSHSVVSASYCAKRLGYGGPEEAVKELTSERFGGWTLSKDEAGGDGGEGDEVFLVPPRRRSACGGGGSWFGEADDKGSSAAGRMAKLTEAVGFLERKKTNA